MTIVELDFALAVQKETVSLDLAAEWCLSAPLTNQTSYALSPEFGIGI